MKKSVSKESTEAKELSLKKLAAKDFYKYCLERKAPIPDDADEAYPFIDDCPPVIYQRGSALYILTDPFFQAAI